MNGCAAGTPDVPRELGRWAREQAAPLRVTLELTPFCNFRCLMCYVRLTPDQAQRQGQLLSAGQWLELARQAREMGTLYLTLTGGEPLLYPEFWELYEALNQMGFLITLLSNGSLIDEGAMERLRRCGMPHAVKLTLYGASDGAYRRVCGVEDGFSRVERAISLLQSAGVPLYLTSTVVRENAGDLQAMYDFARRKGIPFQHSLSVVQSARGAVNTAAQSRFALADFPQELSLEALERCRFPTSGAPFGLCGNYRSALWLTWNGRLQGCAFLNRPSVPWQGDLRSAWKALLDRLEEIQIRRRALRAGGRRSASGVRGSSARRAEIPRTPRPGSAGWRNGCMNSINYDANRREFYEETVRCTGEQAVYHQSQGE